MSKLKVDFDGVSESEMIMLIPVLLNIKKESVRGKSKTLYGNLHVRYKNDGSFYVFK